VRSNIVESGLSLVQKGRSAPIVEEMLKEGCGSRSSHYECRAVCPKGIKVKAIAKLNKEFMKGKMEL